MKSYRFTVRFAGQRITHDLKATNDDEAGKIFINELKAGKGNWFKEITYTPSKMFITYEELSATSN
jgi:hypothetical protein